MEKIAKDILVPSGRSNRSSLALVLMLVKKHFWNLTSQNAVLKKEACMQAIRHQQLMPAHVFVSFHSRCRIEACLLVITVREKTTQHILYRIERIKMRPLSESKHLARSVKDDEKIWNLHKVVLAC
ncbi:hypothetical protein BHE74_00026234 [Ensete ventricosum]|nr:hypothetical protein BHE74_00026234 [Ensete ventricosum]